MSVKFSDVITLLNLYVCLMSVDEEVAFEIVANRNVHEIIKHRCHY